MFMDWSEFLIFVSGCVITFFIIVIIGMMISREDEWDDEDELWTDENDG